MCSRIFTAFVPSVDQRMRLTSSVQSSVTARAMHKWLGEVFWSDEVEFPVRVASFAVIQAVILGGAVAVVRDYCCAHGMKDVEEVMSRILRDRDMHFRCARAVYVRLRGALCPRFLESMVEEVVGFEVGMVNGEPFY